MNNDNDSFRWLLVLVVRCGCIGAGIACLPLPRLASGRHIPLEVSCAAS